MVRIYNYILIILIFISNGIFSQEINVSASVDSSNYLIGDFINFKIVVEHPDTILSGVPSFKDSLKKIEIIEESEILTQKINNKIISTYNYVLAKYDSGDVEIPSLPVIINGINGKTPQLFLTSPVYFTVHSLEVDLAEDIKDIKEPQKIPLDWNEILLWALIIYSILGLILTIFLFVRDYLRKKKQKPIEIKKIFIPAHVRALSSLDELNKKQLWQNGFIKEYHSEITGIIRNYFEERFKFPALEQTSEETVNELTKYSSGAKVVEITKEFFINADLVKFAKYIPMNDINELMMKQAVEIVEKTSEQTSFEEINEEENVNV